VGLSLIVVLLVAAAAVAHATWNIAIKKAGTSGAAFLWLTFVIATIAFAPFGVASIISEGVDLARLAPLALGSGALQVGYFLLLQKAYAVGDVSVVYPLARGTGPLLSVVAAITLLGERPSITTLLGGLVIIAGVVVIGLAGGRGRANAAGILLGLAVGVMIAGYTVWDTAAVTTAGMPVLALYWSSIVVQLALLAPAALRTRGGAPRHTAVADALREHWRAALVVGVLSPLAYILILLAVQLAPLSLIAPAREVSVVLVGLAGWLLFREPHPVQRLIGAGVVLAGVALLSVR
jgi:drug/metabolite transporter (DMT)-like permease